MRKSQFANDVAGTTAPIIAPPRVVAMPFVPEFIRLPKPGLTCPYTGLTRSALNELILATPRNQFTPPVKSFCLRQKGSATGIRLVSYPSLREHILAHVETGQGERRVRIPKATRANGSKGLTNSRSRVATASGNKPCPEASKACSNGNGE